MSITQTDNLNILEMAPLVPPRVLRGEMPMTEYANRTVVQSRQALRGILRGEAPRLLVVVGPCSIHDPAAAMEYARRLNELRREFADTMLIVMRLYFEKPRTTTGWKGLIYDPHMDGSSDIAFGLRTARRLLLDINALGQPTGTELLDPIVPQYTADLVSWAAIGARTTESQTHRQMASGLSMPVGFKNGTDGNVQVAVEAMEAARHPNSFLGVDDDGRSAIVRTKGNEWGHLILRGSRTRPNYDDAGIAAAMANLSQAKLPPLVMVDCSHGNAGKSCSHEEQAWNSVLEQRVAGNCNIIGMMLESNLVEGRQPFASDPARLRYGQSVTDECIGWDDTERMLRNSDAALRGR